MKAGRGLSGFVAGRDETPHVHRWQIETPAPGREWLAGRCDCGAERLHRAWMPERSAGDFTIGAHLPRHRRP